MPLVYEEVFKVFDFECDKWDRMMPGAILRRAQEIAGAQCETLGLNEQFYTATNTLFLLSRMSLEIQKPPMANQIVKMQTRAYGMHRALYHRMTSLYDEEGTRLCEIDSRWVLVDTLKRRILRREPESFNSPFAAEQCDEGHKMEMPSIAECPRVAELSATYSLCDNNAHINNVRYADIVCDYLPFSAWQKGMLRKMLLFYRAEIALGSSFDLSCANVADRSHYFLASQEGQKRFECYVEF